MTIFDDIKRDREDGTPGPWSAPGVLGVEVSGPAGQYVARVISSTSAHNARRIARVPTLESIALAAEELAAAVDKIMSRGVSPATGGRVVLEVDLKNADHLANKFWELSGFNEADDE